MVEKLPEIDLESLFTKSEEKDDQIGFLVKNANINFREVNAMEISDQKTVGLLDRITKFTPEEDAQILQ